MREFFTRPSRITAMPAVLLLLLLVSATAFAAAPTITSYTPLTVGAGMTVTITGTNFVGVTSIKFNGVPSTVYVVASPTTIRAIVPVTTSGYLSIQTTGGKVTSTVPYTYYNPPKITSFSPLTVGAGTTVTITGTGFTWASTVKFNGVAATFSTFVNETTIRAIVPKTTSGRVTVTDKGGTATSAAPYTFVPAPTITSFAPTTVSTGATVTITGTNFTNATDVKFNGVPATIFVVASPTTIRAIVPVTSNGKITVTTRGGTATSTASYTLVAAPTITSFAPTSVCAGTTVTITGTNLTGATSVKFNGVAATTFVVASATTIRAIVPTTTSGKITVTTPGGTATSAGSYTFSSAPTITSFAPTSVGSGTTVTITGTNFTGATSVKFNGVAATSFTVASATSIRAVVPATSSGQITVTTPAGTATSASSYTFLPAPTITSFTPTTGGLGTTVTITGTNFTGTTSVKFNGVNAAFTVLTANSISALVPSTTTGKITLTTPGGTATSAASFTYQATVTELITQGKSKLNQLMMMEPYDAATATTLLNQAYDCFSQARTALPGDPEANFGLALADAAKTAQALINKYATSFQSVGENKSMASLKSAVDAMSFWNLSSSVKNTPGPMILNYAKAASQIRAGTAEQSALVVGMQTDVKNTIMPMLARVAGYLDTVETSGGASFTFPLGTPDWESYTIADIGDVYLFHGALLLARWALAIPASYNVSFGTFDFDASPLTRDVNHDWLLSPGEYLPPSPFATLTSAATMTASKADMSTACAKIIAGINATLAETSDNHDLLAWHTAGSGVEWADLNLVRDYATKLQSSCNAATTINFPDDEGNLVPVSTFIGAWAANPPSDLKVMMPTMEINRYRWSPTVAYEYDVDPLDGGVPDTTFGGLFPQGLPSDLINESRRILVETGYSGGSLSGLTTSPTNGQQNVQMDNLSLQVTFPSYPPARFSVLLQRQIAGVWRGERLYGGWQNGLTWTFYPDGSLWSNSNYRMIITDEVANVSVTKAFSTGADPS
jgi:hypothetical protein